MESDISRFNNILYLQENRRLIVMMHSPDYGGNTRCESRRHVQRCHHRDREKAPTFDEDYDTNS